MRAWHQQHLQVKHTDVENERITDAELLASSEREAADRKDMLP